MSTITVQVLKDGSLVLPAAAGLELHQVQAFLVTRRKDSVTLVPQKQAIEQHIRSEAFKSLALERYLEGELGFDDLVRIVGPEKATLAQDTNQAMKESIESAKTDFGG